MTAAEIIKALSVNAHLTLDLEKQRTESKDDKLRAELQKEIDALYAHRAKLRKKMKQIKPYSY